jgi:Domain of unknown function (DUF5655)
MNETPAATTVEFFAGSPVGWAVYRSVETIVTALGEHEVRVGRSQVAFRRTRGFAYLWRPGRYVRTDVPVVLSLALRHLLVSPRFKDVAHPSRRIWMHHLEVRDPREVDQEVRGWLIAAYRDAA